MSAGDPSGWHCRVARTASMNGPSPTRLSDTPPLLIDGHAALGAPSQAVAARKPPGHDRNLKTILMGACFAQPQLFRYKILCTGSKKPQDVVFSSHGNAQKCRIFQLLSPYVKHYRKLYALALPTCQDKRPAANLMTFGCNESMHLRLQDSLNRKGVKCAKFPGWDFQGSTEPPSRCEHSDSTRNPGQRSRKIAL